MAIYPTSEQIQALLTGPAGQPVVMVNLLRFKKQAGAPDEGMSGEEAYTLYAKAMREVVEANGGRFLWAGSVDSMVIGEADPPCDVVAIVEYPSREKFVEIAQSERVREIGIHRAAGLESQWLIATTARPI